MKDDKLKNNQEKPGYGQESVQATIDESQADDVDNTSAKGTLEEEEQA
jgi:hypothetical protein